MIRASATDVWLSGSHASVRVCSIGVRLNNRTVSVAPSQPIRGIVTQKLKQHRRLTWHEVPFLKEHAHGPYKMTLPSATQFPAIAWKKESSGAAYPQPSDLLRDITGII